MQFLYFAEVQLIPTYITVACLLNTLDEIDIYKERFCFIHYLCHFLIVWSFKIHFPLLTKLLELGDLFGHNN